MTTDATKDPVTDYRRITDALAGALERVAESNRGVDTAHKSVEDAQAILAEAQAKATAAREAAMTVQRQLDVHLAEVLPKPNAASRR